MKRLIITGLLAFLISTTFLSDNPPGWYQQILPVNKNVTDIFFLDSLNGWTCTNWDPQFDTAYIMRTTNGGINWDIQLRNPLSLSSIQFINNEIGYSAGGDGSGKFLKTTNGGDFWNVTTPFGSSINNIKDLKFVNKDTGWICSDDDFGGGIFKTTNGGTSWQRQTTASQLAPVKLFFINQETGWAIENDGFFKTTDSGTSWLFVNGVSNGLRNLFFLNNDTGWIIRQQGVNSIIKTTNGGVSWFVQHNPTPFGPDPQDIFIFNDSKGWISELTFKILSLANDSTWGIQIVPSGFNPYYSITMADTNTGYSGGTIFVKTDDGGGVITDIENNVTTIPRNFTLNQNYPNPFNPKTIISYELLVTSYIKLKIFNLQGKVLKTIVNQKKTAGSYKTEFDGSDLTSGVYFYRIEVIEDNSGRSFSETRKMILIR